MASHLLNLVLFSSLVSTVFAVLLRDDTKSRVRFGAPGLRRLRGLGARRRLAHVPVPELVTVLRQLGLWGPVAAWMALIFGFSSLQMPPGTGSIPDWISHGGVYAGLAALTSRALAGGVRAAPWRVAVLAVALSSVYGVTDEWHQVYVPHRTAEAADVMKDVGGALLGAALFHLLAPRLGAAPGGAA